MTMRRDREYQAYVNTHDKLLQELDEIRLKLSRKMRGKTPQEQVRLIRTMVRDADAFSSRHPSPLPRRWHEAAGMLKGRDAVDPVRYQKGIRAEWEERFKKQATLAER